MAVFDYQLRDPRPGDKLVLIDSSHLPHTFGKYSAFFFHFLLPVLPQFFVELMATC